VIGFKVFNRIVFSIFTTVLSVDLESNNCVFKEFLVTLFFVYEVSDFLGPFLQNFTYYMNQLSKRVALASF